VTCTSECSNKTCMTRLYSPRGPWAQYWYIGLHIVQYIQAGAHAHLKHQLPSAPPRLRLLQHLVAEQ